MSTKNDRDNALNIINQQLVNISNENQFVTFQIEGEEYGIDIMTVQEIMRFREPTKVFNANPIIKGVINFRGQVIPVIDMRRKFNLPPKEYDEFSVVIVIETANKTMGMIVDSVSDIMSFNNDEVQTVEGEFAADIKTDHLQSIAKKDDRIVLLLNPQRVLTFKELDAIKNLAEVTEDEAK